LLDAAFETLIEEGYAGATGRAIAARGGLNPALIFYHFGGVDELLLAALDKSSAERLDRYRAAVATGGAADELVQRAAALFREDIQGGHVTAVTEMMGASLSKPELRSGILKQMQPWLDLTQQIVERALSDSPLAGFRFAAEPVAFAIVSGYLGLNMLSRLMPDRRQTDALFQLLEQVARMVPSSVEPDR
jgi:AcrR family transcriptional regulator